MTTRTRAWAWVGAGILVAGVVSWGALRWSGAEVPVFGTRSGGGSSERMEPSPEIAQRTLAEINEFRSVPGPREMDLTGEELTSLLRYSAPGVLPDGVTPPDVRFAEDRINLVTRVAVGAFPPLPEVERAIGMLLPDSVSAELSGSVIPFGSEGAAIRVDRLRISGVPVPGRLVPRILEVLGREEHTGLPPDAMMVPLPAGLTSAYILSDRLILVTSP